MKKFKKYLEYFMTKLHVLFEQQIFKHNDINLKYMFEKDPKSKDLIVILSACTRKGIKARYNYVRRLKSIECNKLFILDDFAEDHRGGYYLGKNMSYKEEKATKALIDKYIKEIGVDKLIFCGSSKGGYASLNIGCQYQNSYMIVGGPQYYLATYLINDDSLITLKHIIGDRTAEKVKLVDEYLSKRISLNPYIQSQRLFLHYSNKEHTYDEHIRHMIKGLENHNYNIEHNICDYTNHSDISYHFPDYLADTIGKILNN